MLGTYNFTFYDLDNYPLEEEGGCGGVRAFSIRRWEPDRICVFYGLKQYYPAAGDWRPLLDDEGIDAEALATQMIDAVFATADPIPAYAIEIVRAEVSVWIRKFRFEKNLFGKSPKLYDVVATSEEHREG